MIFCREAVLLLYEEVSIHSALCYPPSQLTQRNTSFPLNPNVPSYKALLRMLTFCYYVPASQSPKQFINNKPRGLDKHMLANLIRTSSQTETLTVRDHCARCRSAHFIFLQINYLFYFFIYFLYTKLILSICFQKWVV